MVVSLIALSFNTFFNYCLVFVNFCFPELGIRGAAIATASARVVECIILLILTFYKFSDTTKDYAVKIISIVSLFL